MTDHERYHESAGAYVLGALEPDDRRDFERHLAMCERCRTEVAQLAPVPGLLNRAGALQDEPMPHTLIDGLAATARAEWHAISRSRRWWRWTAVAAVVVALAIGVGALRSSGDPPDVVLALGPGSVTGEVSVDARTWGSALEFELDGLPQRERYVAWVVGADGIRQQCATWGPTPTGRARLEGASAIGADEIASIVITDGDGVDVLATTVGG